MEYPFSKTNRVLELMAAAVLAAILCLCVWAWQAAPQTLPLHYNLAGEADRFGEKRELLTLPIVALTLFAGMTVLEFFPRIWNMPSAAAPGTYLKMIQAVRSMMICVKATVTLDFGLLTFFALSGRSVPGWFLLLIIGLVGLAVILGSVRLHKLKKSIPPEKAPTP